jgi:hypothetical protein
MYSENLLSLNIMGNSEDYAPIALFVYKRPDHTRKALDALIKNPEFSASKFFVYCDGPRHDTDISLVQAVRDLVRSYSLPNIVQVERDRNLGLANSIITGVTELCNKYGKVIVLEDDLITSKYFLKNMNNALNFFEHDKNIWSISGYTSSLKNCDDFNQEYFFSPIACSWGWGTWKNRWERVNWDTRSYNIAKKDISEFSKLGRQFPLMLELQIKGKIDSWAIRWCYNSFINRAKTVYFIKSNICNIGHDGSGTNCSLKIDYDSNLILANTVVPSLLHERMLLVWLSSRCSCHGDSVDNAKGLHGHVSQP